MSEPTFNPRAGVEVHAIFGMREQRGLVVLKTTDGDGNAMTTMHTAAKAREIATMLIEAAGAADGDEAVMMTLTQIGMELQEIGAFIHELREKRALIDVRARQEARLAVAFDQGTPPPPDLPDPPE